MATLENSAQPEKKRVMRVDVEGASWAAGGRDIVNSIDLAAEQGEFVGLIGPNGSGKSSLLRLIYRLYPPKMGLIRLDERDIWKMSTKEVARCAAVVAQERATDFAFRVDEIVMMGRIPHKAVFDRDTVEDDMIVQDALARVGMLEFAESDFHALSGGEKQRVLIARAIAQRAKVFLLDEPTNHLDIRYQLEVLDLLRSFEVTTIMALHDLNLAATYCDRLYLLQKGRIVSKGTPREVLTPSQIESIYGVVTEVDVHPTTGRLHVAFIGVAPTAHAKA